LAELLKLSLQEQSPIGQSSTEAAELSPYLLGDTELLGGHKHDDSLLGSQEHNTGLLDGHEDRHKVFCLLLCLASRISNSGNNAKNM
jgi:hypothetical protein